MEILYIILVLLVTARLFSEMAERIKVPSLVGEIVAGILLGLVFHQFSGNFPILSELESNEVFHAITDLGIFFLMLYAGMELRPKELGKSSKEAVWVAMGGMFIPLALGIGLGWLVYEASPLKSGQMLFTGVALAITAVPVAIKVLMDLGQLKSKAGQIIVSAAVIDDVISLVLLAVLTAFLKTGEMPDIQGLGLLGGKIALFFVITFVVGKYLLPPITRWITHRFRVEDAEMSMLLVIALGFSVLAEMLDMHFILGAFIAGLFFQERDMEPEVYEDVENKMKGITNGFLAPIFFASIGLSLDLTAFTTIPLFVIGLILIATLGKVVGAGLPARMVGLSNQESLIIGNGMNARGAVELIIADIAMSAGLFQQPVNSDIIQNLFSAMVIMAIVTTLMTPLALNLLLRRK